MRPLIVVVLLAVGLAAPAGAGQAPAPAGQDSPLYYFLLGRHLEAEGKLDEAIAALRQAIALAPESAEPLAELAGVYARNDRAGEAFQAAQEALQRDPANGEANRIVGTIYAALAEQRQPIRPGDDPAAYPALAIAALEKSRDADGADLNIELLLGRLYAQTGVFDKALPLLRHVVDSQPGYQEGALLLAMAQESAGRPADAIDTLRQSLEANPSFYRGQLRLADLYERQRQWPEAADALAQAEALNARNTALAPRRAVALIYAGKAGEATAILQPLAAASATPEPGVLYLLAEAQRADKDLPAAEATARRLLAANPGDARGLRVLSLVQQDRGDTKAAEATLRDLVASAPEDANALNSLGYLLAERGEQLDEAVGLLRRALAIEPENPSYLDSLGWAYFQQGRFDQADEPLSRAAEQLTTSSVVQDHLGDLRFKQLRFADAARAWERALAGDGQSVDRARIQQKIRDARSRVDRK